MSKTVCPKCGKTKQPWFDLCFDCNEKEKQKPKCEVCGIEVQEGHYLCKIHWKEREEQKKKLNQIDYVKDKKQEEFKEKFEGTYYYNSQKVKSKSELLICYFLSANQVQFAYERLMDIGGELRPDFIIEDSKGHFIILEHFGLEDKKYLERCSEKINKYKKFCEENKEFSFVSTNEADIHDLKDKLGKKLNETPLKRAMWR